VFLIISASNNPKYLKTRQQVKKFKVKIELFKDLTQVFSAHKGEKPEKKFRKSNKNLVYAPEPLCTLSLFLEFSVISPQKNSSK